MHADDEAVLEDDEPAREEDEALAKAAIQEHDERFCRDVAAGASAARGCPPA